MAQEQSVRLHHLGYGKLTATIKPGAQALHVKRRRAKGISLGLKAQGPVVCRLERRSWQCSPNTSYPSS